MIINIKKKTHLNQWSTLDLNFGGGGLIFKLTLYFNRLLIFIRDIIFNLNVIIKYILKSEITLFTTYPYKKIMLNKIIIIKKKEK